MAKKKKNKRSTPPSSQAADPVSIEPNLEEAKGSKAQLIIAFAAYLVWFLFLLAIAVSVP